MTTYRRPERWLVGTAVLLLHLAGLWAWPPNGPASRDPVRTAGPAPVAVRLLPIATVARPVTTRPQTPPAASRPRPGSPAPAAARDAPAAAPTLAAPAAQVPQAVAPAVPESSVSTPAPLDLRLHLPRGVAAERGGLTEAPDSPRRAALNDPRSNVRSDPTQALPSAVASAAKGDCAKGDYVGAGMGLLSLPFLAAAVIRDACKPAR